MAVTLDTLLDYARFGHVFPLAYRCKVPMKGWTYSQPQFKTQDPKMISAWFHGSFYNHPGSELPWAWIPLVCVIDGDVKKGARGLQSIAAAGGLPDTTRKCQSPSGGFYWYFAADPDAPCRSENRWLDGVDIRYGMGFVLIPGSVVRGGTYKIIVDVPLDQLLPMPLW